MDKIEKIRQESEELYARIDECIVALIEARLNKDTDGEGKSLFQMERLIVGTQQFLCWISDTLSEEPNKSLEEAAEKYANEHYSEWDESWDDYNGHNVEPENDKLELIDAFIAGAQWVSIYGNDIKEL